jgi:Tat protein translocase TatB subunit
MFLNIGTPELLVIIVIALIVVGPKRLPEIGRQVGRAMAELRKVQDEVRDMVKFDLNDYTSEVPETEPIPTPHVVREIDDEVTGNGSGPVNAESSSEVEEDASSDGHEPEASAASE